MKARILGVAVAALALLLTVPSAALAKGASAATINGPGPGTPVTLRGAGEPGAETELARLADQAGLFFAMFGGGADGVGGQILADRPSGDLGPRYTVTYDIPSDQGGVAVVHQDLYPYAHGGPVTFTGPGQRLSSNGQEVSAGWFRGPAALLRMLVSLGLPSKPPHVAQTAAPAPASALAAAAVPGPDPAPAPSSAGAAGWWAGAGVAGSLLVVAALALLVRRHRRVTPPR